MVCELGNFREAGSGDLPRIARHFDWFPVGIAYASRFEAGQPGRDVRLIHPTPIAHEESRLEPLHGLFEVEEVMAVPWQEAGHGYSL